MSNWEKCCYHKPRALCIHSTWTPSTHRDHTYETMGEVCWLPYFIENTPGTLIGSEKCQRLPWSNPTPWCLLLGRVAVSWSSGSFTATLPLIFVNNSKNKQCVRGSKHLRAALNKENSYSSIRFMRLVSLVFFMSLFSQQIFLLDTDFNNSTGQYTWATAQ